MDRIIMCLRAAWASSSMHRAALLVTVPVAFAVSAALPPRLAGQVPAPQVYTATGSDASVVDGHISCSHDHRATRAYRPSHLTSRHDRAVPLRECTVPNDGGCDPTTNVQSEDDDGNTVSMTCELREEVEIPLVNFGVSVLTFGLLESFEILAIRYCDYGPRCGGAYQVDWFRM